MLISAGILIYKIEDTKLKVFLVHPGGPLFINKDEHYWGIPKGLPENDEELLTTAKREFKEETGILLDFNENKLIDLGFIIQKNNKKVFAWAYQIELSKEQIKELKSNTFKLEWPPRTGVMKQYAEVDKGEYFDIENCKFKMNERQFELIERLKTHLRFI